MSEGSDERDVLCAAMYHYFARYGMTHTAEQHKKMIRLVMSAMDED